MSDFCKQCSEEMFGKDLGELSGLVTEKEVADGLGAMALCEGCGFIIVDHEGKCIDPSCKLHGERNKIHCS